MTPLGQTMSENITTISRRNILRATGAAAVAGVAGCSGNNKDTTSKDTAGKGDKGGKLEIVHWWTAGGEKQALNALIEGFKKRYPEVKVVPNPAPGGAGSALDTVIKSRVLNENPPSTFQIWPGKSLHPYIEATVLEDIGDSVWNKEMQNAYLPGVRKLAKPQGTYVAVPLNIHRLNNIFYNKSVVKSAGVDPASINSPAALMDAMAQVESETDAIGMAQQTKSTWSTLQMWEDILIGMAGVDAYQDILNGNVAAHESAVKNALEMVTKYKQYFPKDAGSIAWDQANKMVIQGDAAFIHQGDWAAGQYKAAKNFDFGEEWDYVPFPGTSGIYHVVSDSFVMPKPNPSPSATKKWLNYCGSVEGQKRFNPIKGSIPPRTDVPMEPFGPFLKEQRRDFEDSKAQPPTIAHGTGVVPEVKSSIEGAISTFLSTWNVSSTYTRIKNAF